MGICPATQSLSLSLHLIQNLSTNEGEYEWNVLTLAYYKLNLAKQNRVGLIENG